MRWFFGILLFVLLLLAITPTLLSTSLGKKLLTPAKVESLSFNWFSPQEIKGLSYTDDGISLFIEKIRLEKSLFSLLFSPMDWGPLVVEAPHLKATISGEQELHDKEKNEISFIPPISELIINRGEIEVEGVALHDAFLTLKREDGLQRLPFTLSAKSSTQQGEGNIEAKGVLNGPSGRFLPISFDLNIDRFPLATLDALLPDPLLVRAFGPLLTVHGQLNEGVYSLQIEGERIRGGGAGTIQLEWNPDPSLLSGIGPFNVTFDQTKRLFDIDASLSGPASFLGPKLKVRGTPTEFTVTADALKLSPVKLSLGKTTSLLEPIKGELTRLPSPYQITSPIRFEIENGSIKEGLSSLAFKGKVEGGLEKEMLRIPHFTLRLAKESGSPLLLDGEGAVVSTDPKIDTFLGGEGTLLFSAQGLQRPDEKWEFDPVSFQFKTPLLDAEGYLVLDSDGRIEGGQPVTVHYKLTPQTLQRLNPTLPPLLEPSNLTLELSLISPITVDQLSTWNFQTALSTPSLKFENYSFSDLFGSLDLHGEQGELLATLNGKTGSKSLFSNSSEVELFLKNFIVNNDFAFENSTYNLSADLKDVPTIFFKEAEELFGKKVSLQIDSKGTLEVAQGVANVDSDGMRGELTWQWDDKVIALSSPHFEANIPASFVEPLLESVPVTFEIDNLTIPRDSYFEGSGKGSLQTAATTIYIKENGKKIPLPGFHGQWSLDKNGFHYALKSSNEGLSMSGFVRSRIPMPENWSLQDLNFSLLLRGVDLPSSLLALTPSLARLESVLEPKFSIDLDAKLDQGNGTIVTSLISPNGTLLLDGYLQDGWFFLNRQLELSLQMTPKVAKGLLGELVPLVSSGVKGRSPIRVAIDPRGFHAPVFPFDLNGLEIGQAVVELDQIDVNPTEDLGDLLSILKVQTTPGKPEMLWFTPLYLNFHNGVATLRRVDILISERYPIALWGKVDLLRDKVNLELGLGARTLSQAFGMKGLPRDYILPIALRGSLDDPKIDKPRATAKIGALLAQIEGSPQGLLLSGVLDLVSGGLIGEGVPPPTTNPLPWATDEELEQPARPKTPMKKILKGVEEGAKSILKKIF